MTLTVKIATAGICSLLFLTACGGGSSGDSNEADALSSDVVPATTTDDATDTADAADAGGVTDTTDADNEADTTDTSDTALEDEQDTDVPELNEDSNAGLPLGAAGICTPEGINAWVDAQMRDYYIFADQVPVVDPSEYDDPRALLADLRVAPDIFSSISETATRTALFEEGETFGFGFRWRRADDGGLRFVNVVSGSPLKAAGAIRGDRVVALNGVPELDITDELFDEIFGEINVPTTVTFSLENAGETRDIVVTSDTYFINTVPQVNTFELNGATVGYIESSIFLRTSEAEIDAAIAQLVDANPSDVILDFRYNGGGFVFVAQKFAAQLAGTNFTGEVFQNTTFNDTYTRFNSFSELEAQSLNLNLPRIIVLTTGSTASASEAIANNLSPYLDVVMIGSQTAGKPFASVSNRNCDLSLNAMDRITSNDDGETVLGGLTPTCSVADTFQHPMFSPEDALFGAALTYLNTNTCPIPTLAATSLDNRTKPVSAPIDTYKDSAMPTGFFQF